MTTRLTGAALTVLLAFGAVAATATVGSAWVAGPPPKGIVLTAPATAAFGQPVKLALRLTPKGGGQPRGGTVTFRSGETVLGTATATKRITTITTDDLPVGEPTVTATYSGDPKVGRATSNTVTVVVGTASTTTTVSSAGPVEPGQRAELKAVVRAGATRPTGSVAFGTEDAVLGVVNLNTSGVATWRPVLAEGSHEITARYLGSGTYGPSTSQPVSQVVATAELVVDQSNPGPATDTTLGRAGQTFTAGRTGLLEKVTVGMSSVGQAFTVQIWTTYAGHPDHTILGSGSGTAAEGLVDVTLDAPVPVTAGTTYTLALLSSDTSISYDLTDETAYAGGGGCTWIRGHLYLGGGGDHIFTTWVR